MAKLHTIYPTEFAQRFLVNDTGTPLEYDRRKYLRPILNTNHKKVVVVTARQVGKSSIILAKSLFFAVGFEGSNLLYVTAEEHHMNTFRDGRVLPQFHDQRPLAEWVKGKTARNNAKQLFLSNGSKLHFRAIRNNPDSVRGLSTPIVFIDEAQLIPSRALWLALETTMAYPEITRIMHCGTPGTLLCPFNRSYNASNQQEWIIRCPHCQTLNPPLSMDNISLKEPYLICIHCKKGLDPSQGQFVAQNRRGRYFGYRIPRLIIPGTPWRNKAKTGIIDLLETYSEDRFRTEVLALPGNNDRTAFPWKDIIACCGEEPMVDPDNLPAGFVTDNIIVTIDWAYHHADETKAATVIAIWQYRSDGLCSLLFAKRFRDPIYHEPKNVVADMVKYIQTFQPIVIGVDYMGGYAQNHDLINCFPQKVMLIQYTGRSKTLEAKEKLTYHVNRTHSLDTLGMKIAKQKIRFPKFSQEVESLLTDFLHMGVENDHEKQLKKYVAIGTPDDFVHCTNYAQLLTDRCIKHIIY